MPSARQTLQQFNRQELTYYDLLGCDPGHLFTLDDTTRTQLITERYRAAALKYHPDKVDKEEKDAAKTLFQIIATARDTLADGRLRAEYNRTLFSKRGNASPFSLETFLSAPLPSTYSEYLPKNPTPRPYLNKLREIFNHLEENLKTQAGYISSHWKSLMEDARQELNFPSSSMESTREVISAIMEEERLPSFLEVAEMGPLNNKATACLLESLVSKIGQVKWDGEIINKKPFSTSLTSSPCFFQKLEMPPFLVISPPKQTTALFEEARSNQSDRVMGELEFVEKFKHNRTFYQSLLTKLTMGAYISSPDALLDRASTSLETKQAYKAFLKSKNLHLTAKFTILHFAIIYEDHRVVQKLESMAAGRFDSDAFNSIKTSDLKAIFMPTLTSPLPLS